MEEDLKLCRDSVVLWQRRVRECNEKMKEQMNSVKFVMDRKRWFLSQTGECYHSENRHHVANRAMRQIRPCSYCVPDTMRAVTEFTGISGA